MTKFKKYIFTFLLSFIITISTNVFADNHDLNEILKAIQKDNLNNVSSSMSQNSEEVLTRHLLKLSEIESQFQELTNKFEEINFKLDKLSSRVSKVQADNQLRFQQLEDGVVDSGDQQKISSKTKKKRR